MEYYRSASDSLKNDESVRNQIYEKMELIESGNKEALNEVKRAAAKMLEGMKVSLSELGAEADNYYHESDLIATGKVNIVIDQLKKSDLCSEEKGAYLLRFRKRKYCRKKPKILLYKRQWP